MSIKELLQKLETKKRVVLSLYYLEQLTIVEISEVLDITPEKVKSRLRNARQDLKQLWQQHCNN